MKHILCEMTQVSGLELTSDQASLKSFVDESQAAMGDEAVWGELRYGAEA